MSILNKAEKMRCELREKIAAGDGVALVQPQYGV